MTLATSIEKQQRHQDPSGIGFESTPAASLETHLVGNQQGGKLQDARGVDIENVSEKPFAEPKDEPDDHVYPTGMKLALILFGTAIAIFLVALVSDGHFPLTYSLMAYQNRIVQSLQPRSLGSPINFTL